MKTNLEIKSGELVERQGKQTFFATETNQGKVNVFEKADRELFQNNIGGIICVDLVKNGEHNNVKKVFGVVKGQSTVSETTITPTQQDKFTDARASKDKSIAEMVCLKESVAIFLNMYNVSYTDEGVAKADLKNCSMMMEEATDLVKQAREAFK